MKVRFTRYRTIKVKPRYNITIRAVNGILPSSYLQWATSDSKRLERFFLGQTTEQQRISFWEQARRHPDWAAHCPPAGEEAISIPFKLYGDKGPYYKKYQLMVWSISSPWVHGGNTRLLLCSLVKN